MLINFFTAMDTYMRLHVARLWCYGRTYAFLKSTIFVFNLVITITDDRLCLRSKDVIKIKIQ